MPYVDFNIKPLSLEEVDEFFYGRKDELDFLLNQITKSKGGKAFAISGRRGSGKSTLITKLIKSLEEDKENYLIVKMDVPKEFDEIFLLKRILRKVCEKALKEENVKKHDELLIDILVKMMRLDYQTKHSQQVGNKTSFSGAIKGSLNKIIASLGVEITAQTALEKAKVSEIRIKEYDLERVQNDLEKLLEKLKNVFRGIVIIVDETDKSNYVEAVKTLDNVKPLFWLDKCYYIFVGSEDFYEDYLSGMKTGKKTLLDSLFTRIVYLQPFGKDDLLEMLKRKIGKEADEKTKDILGIIATISKGNPRDAIRYCDLLVGQCGSIEDATIDNLEKVIKYTFPHFPPGNLNQFIPISLYISECLSNIMDPVIESCAVSIAAYILEMKPEPEKNESLEVFRCDKEAVEVAIFGDPSKRYGFCRTEFETALAFLSELGLITSENEDRTLRLTILHHPDLLNYEKMFKDVLR
jgi:DNA polymerase III delta prime subunit